jgi:hypothetical protein
MRVVVVVGGVCGVDSDAFAFSIQKRTVYDESLLKKQRGDSSTKRIEPTTALRDDATTRRRVDA